MGLIELKKLFVRTATGDLFIKISEIFSLSWSIFEVLQFHRREDEILVQPYSVVFL